jgi:F-type H+-transporting ATPase subunit gamma
MSTLKAIKNRMVAVKATHKVTSSMYMVATAKYRRALKHMTTARHNVELLEAMKHQIPDALWDELMLKKQMKASHSASKILILVFSADKGLCGSFNTNTLLMAQRKIQELKDVDQAFEVWPIGQKAVDYFASKDPSHIKLPFIQHLSGWNVFEITRLAERIFDHYMHNDFSDICLIYPRFISSLEQKQVCESLVPTVVSSEHSVHNFLGRDDKWAELFIKTYMIGMVWSALNETIAGEFAARMIAMDAASKNCKERIDELQLEYNKGRQARITKELIEIISGAETINAGK